jgi:hypothetical protein
LIRLAAFIRVRYRAWHAGPLKPLGDSSQVTASERREESELVSRESPAQRASPAALLFGQRDQILLPERSCELIESGIVSVLEPLSRVLDRRKIAT